MNDEKEKAKRRYIKNSGTSLVAQWLRICLPMQGGHGFDPWSRKIPHAAEQLSLCATTTEPACHNYRSAHALEPVLCNKRSHRSEKPVHRNEE